MHIFVQSDIQAEAERLHTELRNTVAMYNQACENLVHAQAKVRVDNFYGVPNIWYVVNDFSFDDILATNYRPSQTPLHFWNHNQVTSSAKKILLKKTIKNVMLFH